MLVGLKEILSEGRKRKIAIGSFNTPNLECLLAVLDAAETLDVPVIVAHAQCHEIVSPLDSHDCTRKGIKGTGMRSSRSWRRF